VNLEYSFFSDCKLNSHCCSVENVRYITSFYAMSLHSTSSSPTDVIAAPSNYFD